MEEPLLSPGPRLDPITSPTGEPVPVTLLTGFLGAGKTTLLNRILTGDHGLKIGVLVNDFGSVNIDAELIEGIEQNTMALTNGCVCCEVRDDLVESLERLLTGARVVDYVIIEASGIADPEGVVMTLLDARYEQLLRLDSITCVVDAEALFQHAGSPELAMLKLRQIGFADLVVLNKVDLVTPKAIDVVREWIAGHLNRVRIVPAVQCDVPLEVLLSVGRFDPRELPVGGALPHVHGTGFRSVRYRSSDPIGAAEVQRVVRGLPESVLRVKGFLHTHEHPGRRMLLQAVGRRVAVTDDGPWQTEPSTDLVVIGSEHMPEDEVFAALDECRTEPAEASR